MRKERDARILLALSFSPLIRWRSKVEQTAEDLEASKRSLQELLQENLCLRVTLQQVAQESERAVQEIKTLYEEKVTCFLFFIGIFCLTPV